MIILTKDIKQRVTPRLDNPIALQNALPFRPIGVPGGAYTSIILGVPRAMDTEWLLTILT